MPEGEKFEFHMHPLVATVSVVAIFLIALSYGLHINQKAAREHELKIKEIELQQDQIWLKLSPCLDQPGKPKADNAGSGSVGWL